MSAFIDRENPATTYAFLEHDEIINYVKRLGFYNEQEQVTVTEVSDGKINHVYRLNGDQKSLILKQAVPYARIVGESMPIPVNRVVHETKVLQEYERMIPGSVPKVFHLDEVLAIVVMEDMHPMVMGRTALNNGTETDFFARDVGEFSAKTTFYTSDFYMDPKVKKELDASLPNPYMREMTEELFFDCPYNFHDSNYFEEGLKKDVYYLSQNRPLQLEVAKLKHKFMTKADALIHSDLHSGAIFMSEEKTVIFDTEFACFGPFGFDVGIFIAGLYLNGIGHPEFGTRRYEQARETWYAYADTFGRLWREESNEPHTQIDGFLTHVMEENFADALGYAGCELVRRSIGISQLDDLNYEEDEQLRMARRKKALELGKYLIMNRHTIRSLEELENWFI